VQRVIDPRHRVRSAGHPITMQRKNRSSTSTAWLVAAAIAPLGGFFLKPMAIVGAVFVLFSLLIAAIDCQ
jgi:hypothetical protein